MSHRVFNTDNPLVFLSNVIMKVHEIYTSKWLPTSFLYLRSSLNYWNKGCILGMVTLAPGSSGRTPDRQEGHG